MVEWLLIIAMMLVTFVPRYVPFVVLNKYQFPEWFIDALSYVPIAVLTVIIVQNSMFVERQLMLSFDNNRLVVCALAAIIAYVTKSVWLTLILGGGVFMLLEWLV